MVSFIPQPLLPLGKSLHCSLYRKLGGSHNSLTILGFEPWIIQPIAYTLYRHSYHELYEMSINKAHTVRSTVESSATAAVLQSFVGFGFLSAVYAIF
jgi:hypothetical protein